MGVGEKGFKSLELQLIGPSLIGKLSCESPSDRKIENLGEIWKLYFESHLENNDDRFGVTENLEKPSGGNCHFTDCVRLRTKFAC